jgi:hypothetical protein
MGLGGANQEPKGATQGSGGARPYYRPVLQCSCHPASETTCSLSLVLQVVSLSLVSLQVKEQVETQGAMRDNRSRFYYPPIPTM